MERPHVDAFLDELVEQARVVAAEDDRVTVARLSPTASAMEAMAREIGVSLRSRIRPWCWCSSDHGC
ncbi:MAG: hypothetical protein ABIQ15_09495 [Nocardioides sp.]